MSFTTCCFAAATWWPDEFDEALAARSRPSAEPFASAWPAASG